MAVQDDVTSQQRFQILNYLTFDPSGTQQALNMENFDEKVRGAMTLALALPSYQLA